MLKFADKLSTQAMGSGIKSRVSRPVLTRNGFPYNKAINGLTKLSKVAKETRFKKRMSFSATALLIISQTGIDSTFLRQAVAQISKPVIHRPANSVLPLKPEPTMVSDTTASQREESFIQKEEFSAQQRKSSAQKEVFNRPCMPALIVNGRRERDIDQIHRFDPSRILTQNLFALRQASRWGNGPNMLQVCLSRAQIAAIERKKEAQEDAEEEAARKMKSQRLSKPLQIGDSVKLWHAKWKAQEWQRQKRTFELVAC
jgi:hypothetical protein